MKEERIYNVEVSRIAPMKEQPRTYFDPESIETLAASIKENGQLVPIRLFPLEDGKHFEIIDGERRWRACRSLGLRTVKAIYDLEKDPEKRYASAVASNFERTGHTPLEIAHAIVRLKKSMTMSAVASTFGKSVAWLNRHESLLKLCPEAQQMLSPEIPKPQRLPIDWAYKLSTYPQAIQLEKLEELKIARTLSRGNKGIETDKILSRHSTDTDGMKGSDAKRRRFPDDAATSLYKKLSSFKQRVIQLHDPNMVKKACNAKKETRQSLIAAIKSIRESLDLFTEAIDHEWVD